jgi:hypothetical protein
MPVTLSNRVLLVTVLIVTACSVWHDPRDGSPVARGEERE